jgi:Secretion system C-terminal sorting domain
MIRRLTQLSFFIFVLVLSGYTFAQKSVTFQVDMGVQWQINAFNPATDSVVMRGDFQVLAGDTTHYNGNQNWAGYKFKLNPSVANDSIYTITIPFPDSAAGKTIQYKFVIFKDRTGSTDTWESVNNRTDSITADASQKLPLVYFNDKTTAGITVNITFQADMTALLNEGFNPSTDSIEVRGDTYPLNWGPGTLMQQDLVDPTLFTVTLQFTGTAGSTIQWKFHCDPQSKFANTGWDNIPDNRTLTFPHADTTLGKIAPAIVVGGKTAAPDTIIFHVDMTNAHEKYHNSLITGLTSVWIGGSTLPLQWPSNWLFTDTLSTGTLIKMYNDGLAAHGDASASDNIYSGIIIFPTNSTSPVYYKYGAVFNGVDTLNGGASYLDNEAGFGLNHQLNLDLSGGTKTVVNNNFGDQVTAIRNVKTSTLPKAYSLSQNYPNPFNPSTKINYELPKSGLVTLKVYNILGQEVATLFHGFQNAGKYIATFDAGNMASGIYFYRLQSGNFNITKKMILMK